jgi:hypothetical protein
VNWYRLEVSVPHADAGSAGKPMLVRLFDATAMACYPALARLIGYTFRVGTSDELKRDGKSVLAAVWGANGLTPPADVASFGEKYDPGTNWIVAYRRGRPVGVMGLLDMRTASVALDYVNCRPPFHLDLNRTLEICRLAILPTFRGGAQTIMVGLLREMLHWSKANGIEKLFSGSTEKLFQVYRRFNPTARLITAPPASAEDPVQTRYYAGLREYGGAGVIYTFDVEGASPWNVFSRFLTGGLKTRAPANACGLGDYPGTTKTSARIT